MSRLRVALGLGAVLLGLPLLYLLAWPVPVAPVAWEPPADAGLTGPFAANHDLADVTVIPVPDGDHGPEDVDVDAQGRIYGGTHHGDILRWTPDGNRVEVFARTGGRPLGLHWAPDGQTLLVADAFAGLLAIDPSGAVRTLATEVGGDSLVFTDDLEVTRAGVVYFSDASQRFDQRVWKQDLLENRDTGRLLSYDLRSGEAAVVLAGLHFANGVALSPAEDFVLVNETSRYRVRRRWLSGPRAGQDEVFLDNLPGFPDGISAGAEGRFWIALASPRNPLVDGAAGLPWLRKVMVRLPAALQPAPERHAHALAVNAQGEVVCSLQDRDGRFSTVTSVQEHDGWLYLGSLTEPALARLPLPDRCRP